MTSARALIVDDDSDLLEFIQQTIPSLRSFKDSLQQVDTAESGLKAIELSKKHSYKFILLDLNLTSTGTVNGFEVIANLRADASQPNYNTPIFLISAFIEHKAKEETAKNFDNVFFLEKPIDLRELAPMVEPYLKSA